MIRRYVAERENQLSRLPGVRQARQVGLWPEADRGWYRTLRRQVRPADLYHACGYRTVGVALDLAAARPARRAGGRVIYDVIDVQLDTQVYAHLPGCRPLDPRRSANGAGSGPSMQWSRSTSRWPTTSARSWPLAEAPTVLLNCQPRWTPPAVRPTHLRDATGIPAERTVVLFLGKLAEQKGLDEAAEAVLRLPDAAFVLMGFGPLDGAAPGRRPRAPLRGPPLHDPAGPSRRRPGLDGLGRRLDRGRSLEIRSTSACRRPTSSGRA